MQALMLEQRVVLGLKQMLLDPNDCFLGGCPANLKDLLKDHPQSQDNILHYLLAGGWAVEILTGEQREHHDIDVITLKKIPFSYHLDIQKSTRYFETLSIKPEKMLKNYTTQVDCKIDEEKFNVYVPRSEYLFMSKLVGFLREPREKDYEDLRSLSSIIENTDATQKRFNDLLSHIPGMNSNFDLNDELFRDLTSSDKCDDVLENKNAKELASKHILEIINNYKTGNTELAKKQASKFHNTLRRVYKSGLNGTISANETKVRHGLYEQAMAQNKIKGFWTGENGEIDLRIFPTKANKEQITYLKAWQNAEVQAGEELTSFEKIKKLKLKKSQLPYVGKTEDNKQVLITVDGKATEKFEEIKTIDDILIAAVQRKNAFSLARIMTSQGETIDFVRGVPRSIIDLQETLLSRNEFDSVDKIEQIKKSRDKHYTFTCLQNVIRNVYQHALQDLRFDDAEKLTSRYQFPTSAKWTVYEEFIKNSQFDKAKKLDNYLHLEGKEEIHQRIFDKHLQSEREEVGKNILGHHLSRLTELRKLRLSDPSRSEADLKKLYSEILESRLNQTRNRHDLKKILVGFAKEFNLSSQEQVEFNTAHIRKELARQEADSNYQIRLIAEDIASKLPVNLNDEERIRLYQSSTHKDKFNIIATLPSSKLEDLFVKDPSMFMPADYNRSNIPVTENTSAAAENLIVSYATKPGHRDIKKLAANITDKFGVTTDALGRRWLDFIVEQSSKGNILSAQKQIAYLTDTGWVSEERIETTVQTLLADSLQKKDYKQAAYIARDLLDDNSRAKDYAQLYLSQNGPYGSPAIKKAFNLE